MKNILSFTIGVAVGALITWTYHKNKYEEMVQEEVESLREHSKKKKDISSKADMEESKEVDDEEIKEESSKAKKIINYCKYSTSPEVDEDEVDRSEGPYLITPDEFATVDGFDNDTFYYYNDDIIVNCNQEMINDVDIEDLFGLKTHEIKEQYGVYEDYAVYVRNPKLKCDYEILLEDDYYFKKE